MNGGHQSYCPAEPWVSQHRSGSRLSFEKSPATPSHAGWGWTLGQIG